MFWENEWEADSRDGIQSSSIESRDEVSDVNEVERARDADWRDKKVVWFVWQSVVKSLVKREDSVCRRLGSVRMVSSGRDVRWVI